MFFSSRSQGAIRKVCWPHLSIDQKNCSSNHLLTPPEPAARWAVESPRFAHLTMMMLVSPPIPGRVFSTFQMAKTWRINGGDSKYWDKWDDPPSSSWIGWTVKKSEFCKTTKVSFTRFNPAAFPACLSSANSEKWTNSPRCFWGSTKNI